MPRDSILIVEDEAITALHLKEELSRFGYNVTGVVGSGEDAVRFLREHHADLVLMDVKLSGPMNGVEASVWIQQLRSIPVIYLTAYPSVFLQNPGDMQRPWLCISKPFSVEALQTTIEVALQQV